MAGATIIAQKVKEMLTMVKPKINYSLGILSVPEAYGYQWYYNGVKISETDGGTSQFLKPVKTGKYKVQVKINPNNETRIVSNEFEVKELYSSVNRTDESRFKVYPNPVTDGRINIETPQSKNGELTVFDKSGKIHLIVSDAENKLDLSCLKSGHYILKWKNTHEVYQTKLLKL